MVEHGRHYREIKAQRNLHTKTRYLHFLFLTQHSPRDVQVYLSFSVWYYSKPLNLLQGIWPIKNSTYLSSDWKKECIFSMTATENGLNTHLWFGQWLFSAPKRVYRHDSHPNSRTAILGWSQQLDALKRFIYLLVKHRMLTTKQTKFYNKETVYCLLCLTSDCLFGF